MGKKTFGRRENCFIIAEAGVNHNGSMELARKLIDIAAGSGADAVKFQTFVAEDIISMDAPKAEYQKHTTDSSETQLDMIKKLELSRKDHQELISYAESRKIMFLSTPFDEKSTDMLVELGVPLIKISSGEITNHPFLAYVSNKGLPIILSTGMSSLSEVSEAVTVIKESGCPELILLHCTSNYPARVEDCNLLAMGTMSDAFGLSVGYSDHTPGIYVSLAAAALGACVIEKHFTIDRTLPGPDHKASLEPFELKELVSGIRIVEKSLGSSRKTPVDAELEMRDIARKSIVANADIPAGVSITREMLSFKRPGTGIAPKYVHEFIGRTSVIDIKKDTLISRNMFETIS